MKLKACKVSFLKLLFMAIFICSPGAYICVSDAVSADDKSDILVIGTGAIYKGNVAEARKSAISEAMIKGVEEYLSNDLGSQSMANNFPRLVHEILPDAREVIENFHILAEEQVKEHYKILVRVKVNQQIIEEKLKMIGLVHSDGPPVKILFIVSQKSAGDGITSFWWGDAESASGLTSVELALYHAFQDRGFEPVNRQISIPEENIMPGMKELDLSDEDAAAWGQIFSSDAVIHGMCEIVEGETVFVNFKAISVENGNVISQDQQFEYVENQGENTGLTIESMERAITKISMRLVPEIIKAFEKEAPDVQIFEIKLTGLKSFAQFMAFSDFLKQDIDGVQEVMQTRIKGSSMTVQVEFKGEKNEFFKEISEHNSFPFSAVVLKTEEDEIIVNIE